MAKYENILLISPMENYGLIMGETYPSGALILIGTMLHNRGYNVKIVHMQVDGVGPRNLRNIVISFKPDVVGITMNTFQTKSAREVSKIVKEVDRDILVVVGGPHPSSLRCGIFDTFPNVDVVVVGEGEHTFMEIVEGKNLSEIKGICYNRKMNELRSLSENLDYIPLPNLDFVDISKFKGAHPIGGRPCMYIMASRGCPYRCIFCNKSVWGHTIRYRKPELVVEEIKWLHEKYGVKDIYFQDDTFNLNVGWAKAVFNRIIENKLNKKIFYKVVFRANKRLVNEELLRAAKNAGVRYIFYGVESGSQRMLDTMKKGLTVEEIKRAFALTHKVGLKTTASFIFGLPTETKETIFETINLWEELKPYATGCGFGIPLPGTEFERIVREKGHLLATNYDEYCYDKCIVRTDELSKEDLQYYRDLFVRIFSIRNFMGVFKDALILKETIANNLKLLDWDLAWRLKRLLLTIITYRRDIIEEHHRHVPFTTLYSCNR